MGAGGAGGAGRGRRGCKGWRGWGWRLEVWGGGVGGVATTLASGSVPWQFVFVAVSAVHGSHGSFARAVPGGSVPVCGSVRGFPAKAFP